MGVVDSKTFRSGNSEAVRLPREVAYGRDTEVTIVRSGDILTIFPKRSQSPAEMVARLRALGDALPPEIREPIEFPERDGL